MAKRDSKGRFVSNGKKYTNYRNNKCTCKEAQKSLRDKMERLGKTVDAEGNLWTMVNGKLEEIKEPYTIIQGYAVPLNPGFLDEYLEIMSREYPDSVVKYEDTDEDETVAEEDDEPNVVICFGEEPYNDDDPDAPKPVWDKDTEVIHINARKPEEAKGTEGKKRKTAKDKLTSAAEHFRKLEEVSKKLAESDNAKSFFGRAVLPKEVQLALDIISLLRSLKDSE